VGEAVGHAVACSFVPTGCLAQTGKGAVSADGIRGRAVVMDADLKSKPGIVDSTDHYDSWLLALEPAFAHDLKQKLKVMAGEPGDFLRATFYRWSERLPGVCLETISAPVVRAVGDVHVGNFGTWPSDGDVIRWGLNDFDETGWMPFTKDLVRLATSALLARDDLDPDLVGRTILSGYSQRIEGGGFGSARRRRRRRTPRQPRNRSARRRGILQETERQGSSGRRRCQAPSEPV
jgi:hypothetical protein